MSEGGNGERGQRRALFQDHVALAEIELCGELMIAASSAEGPLSVDRIDEVLRCAAGELDDVPHPSR
ncbi:hypothetical protein [Streptomyces iconiensis]|uniref:Uncharacterized protein n=1 Tax=Streptomyces iconiensis TaxID=1384038 RepID=A0ABT7AAI0_9ACTN|nr:hypothetical protein [Streptomyces iconiensis]MDJ1138363.1 hypothetical protein [Streptomyces iconiensis]